MKRICSFVPLEPPLRGLRVIGELDMSSALDLTDALTTMDGGGGDVTLELSELEFIDSSGLFAIVQYAGSLSGAGGKLILANPNAMTERIFEIVEFGEHPGIVIEGTSRG